MAFSFDPRGDLPPPTIQNTYYKHRLPSSRQGEVHHGKGARPQPSFTLGNGSSLPSIARDDYHQNSPTVLAACHDWVFSSASNVHVAVDRSQFKTYTSFESYVLRIADETPVKVRGIGTVELRIRRQPGSKHSHTIILENVLHVPKWICNIFSDIYFEPITDFEHTWTDFGVSFLEKKDGQINYWGFTEGFLGLERLVLAKKIFGRSPMLEDQDREVFSVNLAWPQGQRDRWEAQLATDEKKRRTGEEMKLKREAKSGSTEITVMPTPTRTLPRASISLQCEQRSGLTNLSTNILHRPAPSGRASSLKARTTRPRNSSFTERFSSLD